MKTILALAVALSSMQAAQVTSDACYSCHGGSSGPEIRPYASHPVGIVYRPRPRLRVDSRLLVNGRVECTSCHFTHEEPTETPFRIRTDAGVTELCLSCHQLE